MGALSDKMMGEYDLENLPFHGFAIAFESALLQNLPDRYGLLRKALNADDASWSYRGFAISLNNNDDEYVSWYASNAKRHTPAADWFEMTGAGARELALQIAQDLKPEETLASLLQVYVPIYTFLVSVGVFWLLLPGTPEITCAGLPYAGFWLTLLNLVGGGVVLLTLLITVTSLWKGQPEEVGRFVGSLTAFGSALYRGSPRLVTATLVLTVVALILHYGRYGVYLSHSGQYTVIRDRLYGISERVDWPPCPSDGG